MSKRTFLGLVLAGAGLLFILVPASARAATFAPVHTVGGDVWVELPGDAEALAKTAGPARRLGVERAAFVRSLRGAPGEERRVRLVADDGVCEGHIGLERLLGLYTSIEDERPVASSARWMVASKVSGCHGSFSVAVVDPEAGTAPRALGPTDEAAAAAVAAAKRLAGSSRVLTEARTEWQPMFGDEEIVHEAAWRVAGATYALVDVRLVGGECGSSVRIRTVVSQDTAGRVTIVMRPTRVGADDEVVSIADLDADGTAELVARGIDDAVKVWRLGRFPEVVLDGGEVPYYGCSC